MDPGRRELAVLVVNNETHCDFGWFQHVVIAEKMGVSAETIAVLRSGGTPQGLSAPEQLAVQTALEITRNGSATADTVAALVDTWGYGGATDFVVAVGYYTMLAQYFLSMDLQINDGELAHLTMGADVAAARRIPDDRR